jgi:hypothetical protein
MSLVENSSTAALLSIMTMGIVACKSGSDVPVKTSPASSVAPQGVEPTKQATLRADWKEARASVPEVVRANLPQHGIYAAGGGLTSGSWRITVDYKTGTMVWGRNKAQNSKSFEPMPESGSKVLGEETLSVLHIHERAYTSEGLDSPRNPNADYSDYVVIADGDKVFTRDHYGPARGEAATRLLRTLRAAAGFEL